MSDAPTERDGAPPSEERSVVLGSIGGAFGVQGWVKVNSYTEPPDNILSYRIWQLSRAGRRQPVEVEDGRVTAKGVLVKLAGIDTPEDARLHTGAEVVVARSELPEPAPGEYYWSDLEGLEAVTKEGETLGRVDHFRTTPGGPIAVIRGEREHWIPFVKEHIARIDLEGGRVVFDWAADW